jgi:hypothetical protein
MSPEWIDPEREKAAWDEAEHQAAYQQQLADEEADYQRRLSEEGEREYLRLQDNYSEGDVLGYDDGRPGLGIGLDPRDGFFITMPWIGRVAFSAIPIIIILIASLIVRGCVGEERAQQILHETPSQSGQMVPDNK